MIKVVVFLLLFPLLSFALDKTPSSENGYETGVDLRVLKKHRRFIFVAESKNRKELGDTDYNQVLFGSYYRLTKRFRLGAFMQVEQGLRWDEDWVKGAKWEWQDINSRWDYSSVLDATYTDQFAGNFLWELKSRLYYYHSREALQLRLRPGLRYFILKFGRPQWQFFTEIEAYLPLSYGENWLYEYWAYVGSLYQVTPKFSVGPVISFRERWFHAYDDFEKKSGQSFKSNFESTYLGINVLYNF